MISLDGKLIRRVPCGSRVESLDLVANSDLLLAPSRRPMPLGSPKGVVEIWKHDLTDLAHCFDNPTGVDKSGLTLARSSPCGRYILGGERRHRRASLFDRSTGSLIAMTPPSRDEVTDVAYSPHGDAIAVGYRDGSLACFTLREDREAGPSFDSCPLVVDAHEGETTCTRFLGDGMVASSGTDGVIRLWDVAFQGATALEATASKISGLDWSPEEARLIATSTEELLLIDAARREIVFRLEKPGIEFTPAKWSRSGELFAVGSQATQTAMLFDREGRSKCSIADVGLLYNVDFSPDGALLATVAADRISIVRLTDGARIFRRPLDSRGFDVAFSHDGTRLAYGEESGVITVIDVATMSDVYEIDSGSSIEQLAFSPDDTVLATGHGDSVIRLWHTATGTPHGELSGHEIKIRTLAFSPDGHALLSSANDGTVRLWSVDEARSYGIVHRRDTGHIFSEACIASLSADGRRLAVGDRTARHNASILIWDIELESGQSTVRKQH
jgi:WD40 repeat protein